MLSIPSEVFWPENTEQIIFYSCNIGQNYFLKIKCDDPDIIIDAAYARLDSSGLYEYNFRLNAESQLRLSTTNRINRQVTLTYEVYTDELYLSSSYLYTTSVSFYIYFEENSTLLDVIVPDLKWYNINDTTNCKIEKVDITGAALWNVYPYSYTGLSFHGFKTGTNGAIHKYPIDNFIPDNIITWSYAVAWVSNLDHGCNISIQKGNKIEPYSFTRINQIYPILLKPSDILIGSTIKDGYGRGLGISSIHIYG